jgi:hypothetical protein
MNPTRNVRKLVTIKKEDLNLLGVGKSTAAEAVVVSDV